VFKFENIAPLTVKYHTIHLTYNFPMPLFDLVEKEIEISHWGSIEIREHYKLKNLGASLDGEFSRAEYDLRSDYVAKNAIKMMPINLPESANSFRYEDLIGNISTSYTQRLIDSIRIYLFPRFAILGGWQNEWMQNYQLPIDKFLYVEKDSESLFILNQTFFYTHKTINSKFYKLKIILPNGASNYDVIVPFDVKKTLSTTYSYLDIDGRPTITLEMNNAHAYYNKQISIKYEVSSLKKVEKPLLLIGLFAVFFVLIIVMQRMNIKLKDE
jgi:oligosaccharyltransferase complex subunit alpha (ribophorin I)